MIQRQSSVTDQYDRPVPGAEVYVYDSTTNAAAVLTSDGVIALAQPVKTDEFGVYTYWADTGLYREEIRYGGKLRYREAGIGIGAPQPSTEGVATRAAMAAVTGAVTGNARRLSEAGREGVFQFDSSNLSALVTADPNQGIYVAPASAPTGAAGAWVRKYDGTINIKWFGAKGDGVTVDYAAFVACQTYIGAVARAGYGYNYGVPSVRMPFGVYNFAGNPFDLIFPIHWFGEGGGGSGNGTVCKWNNTSSGWRDQFVDTTGDTGVQAPTAGSGSGAIVEDVAFFGGFDSLNEAERHGVLCRGKISTIRCSFFDWAGDGLRVDANVGGGHQGNANTAVSEDCFAQNCRNGVLTVGGDANACNIRNFSTVNCRRWGVLEGSFLGNQIIGGHWDGNSRTTWNTGAANHPISYVHDSGNWYFAIHGQEVGASTNRPSTTTADNTWWGFWQAGGASPGNGIPTWFNGIAVRSGGPIIVDGLSNNSGVAFPHVETNGVSQYDQYATIIGGQTGTAVKVSAGALGRNQLGRIRAANAGIEVAGQLVVLGGITGQGNSNAFGVASGTVTDNTFNLDSNSTSNLINFRVGGVAKTTIANVNNALYYDTVGVGSHNFRLNGGSALTIASTGLTVNNGGLTTSPDVTGVLEVGRYSAGFPDAFIRPSATASNLKLKSPDNTDRVAISNTGIVFSNPLLFGAVTSFNAAGVLQAAAVPAFAGGDITSAGASLVLTLAAATVVAKVAGQALAPASVVATSDIRTSGGKIGYNTGAGGTQAQATSKATGVTLNKVSGEITLNAANLAADTTVSFVFTNSQIEAGDNIAFSHASVGTFGAYIINAHGYGAGSCTIDIHNATPGALAEAIVVRFTVLKGATA